MNKIIKALLDDNKPETGQKACEDNWDLSELIPIPKFPVKCPFCGSRKMLIRNVTAHQRIDSPTKWRVIVSFKCTICSHITTHGVVVTKDYVDKMSSHHPDGVPNFSHRQLRQMFGFEEQHEEQK